jgi:HJR/Mrr/RecB family endonuclease
MLRLPVPQETMALSVDIIVAKNGLTYAIQAKRYSGTVGNHAVGEVVAGQKHY